MAANKNRSGVFGIASSGSVDIRDNVVDGVAAAQSFVDGSSTGITAWYNDRGAIIGNRVGGLVSTGTGNARGIRLVSSTSVTVRDNILVGDTRTGGVGIACPTTDGLAVDNVVMKFPTTVSGCTAVNTTP